MGHFEKRSRLPVPARVAYDWHARPGAFERLTPPWSRVELLDRQGSIEEGRVEFRVQDGPVPIRWVARHHDGVPGEEFRDSQESGPFASWEHRHRFLARRDGACDLLDSIAYTLPLEPFSSAADALLVRPLLERMFGWRHRITRHDLALHSSLGLPSRHFLVSGAGGLVGSALVPFLTTGGHRVTPLLRRAPRAGETGVPWDPSSGIVAAEGVEPIDVVVHLAGENLAAGRWTPERREEIVRSRSLATRRLCESLARLRPLPRVLLSASAIGFYGNRGDEPCDEETTSGSGFLAEVCREWEAATEPARAAGIRVVNLRFGVVLSPRGGLLGQLWWPFQLGLGGRVGNGRQFLSWVGIDDVLAAVLHGVATESLSGPVNVVSPEPVPNAEFAHVLGRVLRRPTLFPLPAAVARGLFGEMADEMLLSGARVRPGRLLGSGFKFWHPQLGSALRHLLGA